ncbi:hypothetical protein N665_0149s0010 [Sinapis alba]|nr:hypothetical protein N665_0149s0010 [Sinapis alba]
MKSLRSEGKFSYPFDGFTESFRIRTSSTSLRNLIVIHVLGELYGIFFGIHEVTKIVCPLVAVGIGGMKVRKAFCFPLFWHPIVVSLPVSFEGETSVKEALSLQRRWWR